MRELFLNCDLVSHEESLIRDDFFANMQDGEIQRELLTETRFPKKALELVINVKIGIQNHSKFWKPLPTHCQLQTLTRHLTTFINRGTIPGPIQIITSRLSVLTAALTGVLAIAKIVKLEEKFAETVVSTITLQKFVVNQKTL